MDIQESNIGRMDVCTHPHLEKEIWMGAPSGDYICPKCGKSGWGREWARKDREKIRAEV